MAEILVDGVWLRTMGHVGSVKWSTRWGPGPCGPDLASCTLALDPASDTSWLRLARTFEVWSEGVLVFGGPVQEMGREFPRSIKAKGWARRAADFDAVDEDGNPTTNPHTAVTQAIANGLEWTDPDDVFPDAPLGTDGAPTMQRLDVLLNAWAATAGLRWGVDPYGVAFTAADETEPTLYLDASDLPIGVADDGLYTRVRARFTNSLNIDMEPDGWESVTVDDAAGQAEFGVIEYPLPLDYETYGLLDATAAGVIAQAQLDLLTVPQWLSRVVTTGDRLRTEGDHSAHLSSVEAGVMVRLFNVPTYLGGLRGELGLDVVLGEVEHDEDSPREITVAPLGLAVRNIADQAAAAKRDAA